MTMVYLIDINAFLALAWPNHPHHGTAIHWFDNLGADQWATCATTQLGFVRISCQPKFSRYHVSPESACDMLDQWTKRSGHVYWHEETNGLLAPEFRKLRHRILTHNFVTDGFLASVAAGNQGKLATFDRPLANVFPDIVELISHHTPS